MRAPSDGFAAKTSPLSRLLNRRLAGLELIERAGLRLRRFLGACLFHVALSTDGVRSAYGKPRDRMGRGGQALGESRDVGLELGDQAPLELAFAAVAER